MHQHQFFVAFVMSFLVTFFASEVEQSGAASDTENGEKLRKF